MNTQSHIYFEQIENFLYEFSQAKENLQLRVVDLLNVDSQDDALVGVAVVLHIASPNPPGIPKHEDDLIKRAVYGTRNVALACLRNKVKRLIFTSFCYAFMVRTDGKVANQDDWSQENLLHYYPKSKFLAEKLFWELAEQHKEELEFVSILPSLVTGPAFNKHCKNSESIVSEFFNGGYPGVPKPSIEFATVDVRDVAIAQVNALEYPEARGRRFIVSGGSINTDRVFDIIRNKYEPLQIIQFNNL